MILYEMNENGNFTIEANLTELNNTLIIERDNNTKRYLTDYKIKFNDEGYIYIEGYILTVNNYEKYANYFSNKIVHNT